MYETNEKFPVLLSYKDLIGKFGLTRTMTYRLLNNPDCPVVIIGRRRFMDAEKFKKWLDGHGINNPETDD